MTKTEFVPLTAESALEHTKQGNAGRLYYLSGDRILRLPNGDLLFVDLFNVQFFLRVDTKN